MKVGFGKHCSGKQCPAGATGRGTLRVGWLRLPVPIPVSRSQQRGCAGEIGKDLAWRPGSQSSRLLLLHPRPLCNPLALPAKGVSRNPRRRVPLGVQPSLGNSSAPAPKHRRALRAPWLAPCRATRAPASCAPAAAEQRHGVGPSRALHAFGDGMGRPDQAGGRQG